ncbi:glycosyl hydrolase-related protein [Paenibacillus sp. CC-CFT747]|nr:glycosyl hydrolase-related protein [Paenibacillus sp. CC-CFT747]
MAPGRSFLLTGHPHVMVEAVKKAEKSSDLIVRLFETAGTRLQTTVTAGFPISEAWLSDLMENKLQPVEVKDRSLPLTFGPFEIVTLRLARASAYEN